jgi:hypothetical protein
MTDETALSEEGNEAVPAEGDASPDDGPTEVETPDNAHTDDSQDGDDEDEEETA